MYTDTVTSLRHKQRAPQRGGGLLQLFHLIQYPKAECVTFGAVGEDQRRDIPLTL